jgi:hypothetical protein
MENSEDVTIKLNNVLFKKKKKLENSLLNKQDINIYTILIMHLWLQNILYMAEWVCSKSSEKIAVEKYSCLSYY